MARKATANEIRCVLREHSIDLIKKLPVSTVQLSFPTDGKGPRIKVSVPPGLRIKIPKMIEFVFNSETILLPLETIEDYQEYELYA